jgi:carbon storage regulator CsrA
MLVLTRKLQQRIQIGDQITVTILRVKGNTVRVGIEAPREVRVIRGELPKDGEPASDLAPPNVTIIEETIDPDPAETSERIAPRDENSDGGPRLPQLCRFDRYGAAPLKQLVAQAVLAK